MPPSPPPRRRHRALCWLDLGLPDMDGVKVVESVRAWSGMPIIVVSARSEDADKIRALDAGADDYLTKPFSVEELLARIRTTLRRLSYAQTAALPPRARSIPVSCISTLTPASPRWMARSCI